MSMKTKFKLQHYTNDVTKTCNAIREVCTPEFRNKFVLETNSGWMYITQEVNGKRKFNNVKDVEAALKTLDVDKKEIRYIQQYGWYQKIYELLFVEGDNSEWFDIVTLETNATITAQNPFSLKIWAPQIIRVYKDSNFKIFNYGTDVTANTVIQDALWNIKPVYNDVEATIGEKFGLHSNKEFKAFTKLHYNDLMSFDQPGGRNSNNYRRYLAPKTLQTIKRVLGFDASLIDSWDKLRERITHPNKGKNTNTAETKATLLSNVLRPIIKNIKPPIKKYNKEQFDEATKLGYKNPQSCYKYDYEYCENCFVRNGDWIVYKEYYSNIYCYNVVSQKKYIVVGCYDDQDGEIGVLKINDLSYRLYPYSNINNYYKEFFPNGEWSYDCKTRKVIYDNWEYDDFPKCLNDKNEEISPAECFAGTIVPTFLEVEKDWKFVAKRGDGNTKYIGNIEEICSKNRIPAFAFILLFIPKEDKLLAEQLFKLKLNGLLSKLLFAPHSFESKENQDSFCVINKKGTNLKTILNFPLDKLRVLDKIMFKRYQVENHVSNIRRQYINLQDLKSLFGDQLNTIDMETFEKIVNTLINTEINYAYIDKIFIAQILRRNGKSFKYIVDMINKIDCGLYRDYIRIREQYLGYFDNAEEREQQEKIYKLLPERAKKFVYLRDRVVETYWGETRHESIREQYNSLCSKYRNTKTDIRQIFDDRGLLIGCILDLDEGGWVRYMHDELQKLCDVYQNELKEKKFADSVQRLLKYEYKGKELSVVAPKKATDLVIEGRALEHCVSGFVDAVIRGYENVLFIRRNDKLEQPFFTMALSPNGNIEQIHGFKNCDLSKEAQEANYSSRTSSGQSVYDKTFDLIAFIKEWAREKAGLVNAGTIRENYGALLAH